MPLFPLFVKLDGRACLVVGAGSVGESKIASLLEAGAKVRVISPNATRTVQGWAAQGHIEWAPRRFEPQDLEGVFLVVAAIPAGDVSASVHEEARRRGVLCNSVDDPAHCDFYYPAIVKRGDFQIAISTSGLSPALAQRLRKELEAQFGPEYETWLNELGRIRQALFSDAMDPEDRKRLLHELASEEALETYLNGLGLKTALGPELAKPSAISLEPAAKRGKVLLIGAGPGDPELLTLKALRALGTADVVLHDDLVPAEVLELVPPNAEVKNVGKRHGEHHTTQEQINAQLLQYAKAGRTIVRLKGGDVSIFGRANEEIDALRSAGLAVDVVPGVTAASAAAASASVSLTDRRASSAVVFVTAQTCQGSARPDWRALVSTGGTLAIYMPGLHYARLAGDLLSAGLDAETPCLVVSCASQDHESKVGTTLSGLAAVERLPAPAIVIVGEVVRQKNPLKAMSHEPWAMSNEAREG